jgi:hypothetical protein
VLIVDANVLLYAVNVRARQHVAARRWREDALAGRETVGFVDGPAGGSPYRHASRPSSSGRSNRLRHSS